MKTLHLTLRRVSLIIALLVSPTAHSSGFVNVNYNFNPIDSLIGLSGGFTHDFGNYDIEVEGQGQRGDIIEGDLHAAVAFDVSIFQVKPFAEVNLVKTDDWGRTLDGGAKLNFPIGVLDFAGGLFLRNSDAFRPIETGTRVQGVEGSEKWDTATLLNFDDLGLVNGILETKVQWHRVNLGIAAILDISNQAFHQFISTAGASWQWSPHNIQFSMSIEHIAQAGNKGGQQFDVAAGFGIKF